MTAEPGPSGLVVRGAATAEELAAVLAALHRPSPAPAETGYERWRRERLAAVRRSAGSAA